MSAAAVDFAALTSPRRSSHASQSSTSSSSTINAPSSPSFSTSGSELSYNSDTEAESNATDYITTPPTSPQRAQQIFQQMMSSPPSLRFNGSSASRTSPVALGSMLSSVKLATEAESSPSSTTPTMSITPSPELLLSPPKVNGRPPLVQSLSAKRARHVPGTLDLSSLPQFSQHPALHLTPQGSEISGSTPRAAPERPGLFSRWSTDSEGVSSCTSSDCESEQGDEQEAYDESTEEGHIPANEANAEHVDHKDSITKRPPVGTRSVTMKRTISAANPFFLSPSLSLDPIPSPLPIPSPSLVSSLLPPAPKPHQHGFSPYAEEQGFAFGGSSPSTSISSPLAQLSPTSPSVLHGRRKKRSQQSSKHRSTKQGGQDDGFCDSSDSRGSSPADDVSNAVSSSARLTRSQGLRIKDQGDKPRGRYARALSQQLRSSADGSSSPMKTATALLGGTISPADSTTDPLRVKLREMPGAKTPDGSAPPSPSLASSTSRQSLHSKHHNQHLRPSVSRSLSSPKMHASSPLHLTSFPGESDSGAKDTKLNVFNSAFSFANKDVPARSPLALKSPKASKGSIKEVGQDFNPYFAGYA